MSRYKLLLDVAKANYNAFKNCPDEFAFVTGLIAEGIHRMKPIHTGLISEEANRAGVKICREHFFGRLGSAKLLMKKIAEGRWSDDRLVAFIQSRSRVHYTTSAENQRLKNYDHLHWRAAYKQAGICLVDFSPRRKKKYIYNIDGMVYNVDAAAEKYGITNATVLYRCNSNSKKWANWKKVKLQG
jgi:hypothetical protein